MLRAPAPALRALVLGMLLVLAAGCRATLVAPVEVRADGSAVGGLILRFDPRMLAELDSLGVDPTAELSAVVAQEPAWDLVRTREEDGSLTVAVTREVAQASELPALYRELVAGLGAGDPALVLDLTVERDADGATAVEGTALLRTPADSGLLLEGQPVGDDGATLAALLGEHVSAAVEVSLPGNLEDHDGVVVSGDRVRIELVAGEQRPFRVRSGPPSWWASLPLDTTGRLAVIAGGVLLAGLALVLVGRRRGVSPGA